MKETLLASLVLLVAAAGCGGGQHSSNSAAASCTDAGAHIADHLVRAGERDNGELTPDEKATALPQISDAFTARCSEDHWSSDAIACVIAATDETLPDCASKLTPEQHDKVMAAMDATMDSFRREGGDKGAEPPDVEPDTVQPPRADPNDGGE